MKFYRIRVDGSEYKVGVDKIEEGVYRVKLGEKEAEVFVEESYEGYEVKSFKIGDEQVVAVPEMKPKETGGNAVTSVLPGVVVKILVKPGDRVKVGDPLFIIESMKMENEVVSHKDGVVKEITVKEGQRIEAGDVLAVIQ